LETVVAASASAVSLGITTGGPREFLDHMSNIMNSNDKPPLRDYRKVFAF
jgi:hypothetical protein